MRTVWWVLGILVLGGCSDDDAGARLPTPSATTTDSTGASTGEAASAATAMSVTTSSPASPTTEPIPSALRRPPPIVDPTRARSVRDEVRELRRLVRAGDVATAAPRFVALATREAGNARLHCEAGFVALRGEDFAAAETQIEAGLAIFRRSGAIADADRVPYAMCLYNRGRLAQADGDRHLAIVSYRQSLSLRPNETVRAKLAEAEAMPDVDDADVEESEATRSITRTPVVGGSAMRTAEHVHEALPNEGVEEGCFEDSLALRDPVAGETTVMLVGACPETFSIFRDFGFSETPIWVDAGAPYGHVLTVRVTHGGRGDHDDGIVDSSSDTLFMIAVVEGAWKVAAIPVGASVSSDCANDPCDDPETTEDDDQHLRAEWSAAFRMRHNVAEGAITLTMEHREGELDAPEPGRRTLVEAFAEWGR